MKIIDEVYPLIKCEARLSDDGTLWIKTDTKSADQTKRVLIEYAENSFCKTFYQDCDEPPTIPMFTESAEAYKAWTGEEMGRPHGRLIDADVLYKKATDLWDKSDSEDFEKGIFKLILNAPTVSADRPHGEWKHNKAYSSMEFCSECGMPFLHEDKYPRNYCPNCGSEMDVKK